MAELGHEVSATGVARLYRDICATMVIDEADEAASSNIRGLDVEPVVRPTIMRTLADKERVARETLALLGPR